jgi:hypothetical protein
MESSAPKPPEPGRPTGRPYEEGNIRVDLVLTRGKKEVIFLMNLCY